MKTAADRLDGKKYDEKMLKMLDNAAITRKLHKVELQDQIRNKKHSNEKQKDWQDKLETQFNRQIEEDDTLMAIYPKIKGIPEQRMKAHYRNELGKIHTMNREANDTRKELSKLMSQNENAQLNAQNEMAARDDKEEKEQKRKDLLLRNLETQKTQMQQIMQKDLLKKLRVGAEQLEQQIVHT